MENITLLSEAELDQITGGANWSCFASWTVLAVGVMTMDPLVAAMGASGVDYYSCV